jgi:CHAT domain-containing protein
MLPKKIHLAARSRRVSADRLRTALAIYVFVVIPVGSRAQSPTDLLAQADHLADQGNWLAAAPLYSRAEAAFHNAGDLRNEIHAKIGLLHRDEEEGSYRVVRAEAVRLLDSPAVQNDPILRIRALALIGAIDLNLNTAAALQDWTQVRAIASNIGDAKWENRANGQLGLVAGVSGNIGAAALALNSAIGKAEQLGDTTAYIYFSAWLANGMAVNGTADRAVGVLNRATEFAKKNGFAELPLQLSIGRIRALMNLPETQREQGLADANKLIQESLAQAQRERVAGAETEILNAAGQIAAKRKDAPAAEKAYSQAIAVASGAALPREEADGCLNLARFYRAQQQYTKAAAVIDRGIRAIQRVEEAYDLPGYIAERAEVEAGLGQIRAADASFQRATTLVEGLLVNAPSSQVKSGMIGALSDIYLGHFRLAWEQLHDAKYAFAIIESARGRALFDSIRYARETGPVNVTQVAAENEIARLQRSLMHDSLTPAQTKRTLDLLDRAYMQLPPLESGNPVAKGALSPPKPTSVAAVQAQLLPGDTLIEYVLHERGSYAITITRQTLKIHALPPRSQISSLSRTFVTAIRNGNDARDSGQKLYSQLIAPMLQPGTTSLIIVPDGPLHLVPFSALQTATGAHLTETLTLSAAPSATIYEMLSAAKRPSTASKPFLGVAFSPPDQGATLAQAGTRGLAELRAGALTPLRFAREEVTEAARTLGSQSVTLEGAQASEMALKAEPLGEFRIIHIAAHGVSDATEPDRAGLVLSPGSANEDGLWQAREIIRSRLNADAVVLSACETGSGRLQGQEGVMNLARAFLIAGSRSVVASLWSVDDRSTATLMEAFYTHLKSGSTVSQALREAQRDFIKDYGEKAKPNLWAGFEVIGYGATKFATSNNADVRAAR